MFSVTGEADTLFIDASDSEDWAHVEALTLKSEKRDSTAEAGLLESPNSSGLNSEPCWKIQHMLVMYVLKQLVWAGHEQELVY